MNKLNKIQARILTAFNQNRLCLFMQRYGGLFVSAWIGVTAIVALATRIFLVPFRVSLNYNEGWNAFHAVHAYSSVVPFYPSLDASISNNYPPLSFYIVGGIGQIFRDNIITGRIISLLSLLVIAICIGWIVMSKSSHFVAGILAGLVFLATFTLRYYGYVAMNDPQLFAHAIQIIALVWLFRSNNRRSLVGISILMAVSILIKHNLLALPTAIAVWLLFYKRRSGYVFIAITIGIVIASFTLFYVIYGSDFLIGILKAPRTYSFREGYLKIKDWLMPQCGLIVIGLFIVVTHWREHKIQCIGLFAMFALLLGAAIAGGAGVNYNAVFDVTIALSLLSGFAIASFDDERIRQWGSRYPWNLTMSQLTIAIILSLNIMLLGFKCRGLILESINTTYQPKQLAATSEANIALIASYKDPVVCEEAALCYWAGKTWEMDLFNVQQKLATGSLVESDLIHRIENREFSLFVVNIKSERLTEPMSRAIKTHYEKFRSSVSYEFWRPRS